MQPILRGAYAARLAEAEDDLTEAQALRHLAFRPTSGAGQDSDEFDAVCRHLLVRETATDALVACCRLQDFAAGSRLSAGYSAQFYDLSRLAWLPGRKLEIGRFCLHPARRDPDILRLAWGALTAIVDEEEVALLFGCTSFPGADPALHLSALAALRTHIAPEALCPGMRAAEIVPFPATGGDPAGLPPLLRSYLAMGGYVSDHAVIDHHLDTLHVLTILPIDRVPPARARALRAIVQGIAVSDS